MAKRPTLFYSNSNVSYFELGDYFAARYDFTDENAPIYLVDARTQEFAIIGAHKLHVLFRAVNKVIEATESDACALLGDFEDECARLIQNAIEDREDEALREAAREEAYMRQHEQGLRDQWRYI
jgi:hypothetical protein